VRKTPFKGTLHKNIEKGRIGYFEGGGRREVVQVGKWQELDRSRKRKKVTKGRCFLRREEKVPEGYPGKRVYSTKEKKQKTQKKENMRSESAHKM